VAAASTAYTYFAADVSITLTGDVSILSTPRLTRRLSYRVVREKTPNGVWQTSFALKPARAPMIGALQRSADLARVQVSDYYRIVEAYNGAGQVVSYESPKDTTFQRFLRQRGLRSEDTTSFPQRPVQKPASPAPSTAPAGTAALGDTSATAWLAKIVVGPTEAADTRAQIESAFGRPTGQINGLDRYVTANGTRTMELLLNRTQGLIAEANLADSGKLVHHATFGYTQRADGSFLRTSARVEVAPRKGQGAPTVIQYSMSNVVIQ
jgi:hypothetical protein